MSKNATRDSSKADPLLSQFAVTADGSELAHIEMNADESRIYIRAFDAAGTQLTGSIIISRAVLQIIRPGLTVTLREWQVCNGQKAVFLSSEAY